MYQLVSSAQSRRLVGVGVLSLALAGCGSDGGDPASPLRTGVFLDSAVEGLGYATDTMQGKTDASGEFNFNAGENITFSIGGFELPTVQAANTMTPLDIFGSASATEPKTADLARLLQSMDSDGDVSNGISLPLTVESITSDTQLSFGEPEFAAQAQALITEINGDEAALIDVNTATAHLNQTLIDNQLITDGCSSDHTYVGRSVELSTRQHGVSGTLTVLNDCEIEVTNFNYDGGGPSVYFYAALDRDYDGDSFIIGPRLNGQRWANDTIRLPIPEGKSLDDFNSLSVWCSDVRVNFGDASFGDS